LLADPEHEIADKYGTWKKKSMYGRTYMGVARTTYLIAPDGTVARRWDDVKVNGHAADVLRAVGEL
jgi:peroxiredoxin Q/BCP